MNVFNALEEGERREMLQRCCGSRHWVAGMLEESPFRSELHIQAAANMVWWRLPSSEWMEAFAAHPRIGDVAALKEKFASRPDAWEGGEQEGAKDADEAVLLALARGNDDYESKFGHVFLICATGKTAAEMLSALQQRIVNDAHTELLIAAGEQAKICSLRLVKLVSGLSTSSSSKL